MKDQILRSRMFTIKVASLASASRRQHTGFQHRLHLLVVRQINLMGFVQKLQQLIRNQQLNEGLDSLDHLTMIVVVVRTCLLKTSLVKHFIQVATEHRLRPAWIRGNQLKRHPLLNASQFSLHRWLLLQYHYGPESSDLLHVIVADADLFEAKEHHLGVAGVTETWMQYFSGGMGSFVHLKLR